MKIDTEDQRGLLLQLIAAATFPGTAIDTVYALKQAVFNAGIDRPSPANDEDAESSFDVR